MLSVFRRNLDAITDPFQNQRGRLTVINYNVETAEGSAKDTYRRQAEAKRQEKVEVELPSNPGSYLRSGERRSTRRRV